MKLNCLLIKLDVLYTISIILNCLIFDDLVVDVFEIHLRNFEINLSFILNVSMNRDNTRVINFLHLYIFFYFFPQLIYFFASHYITVMTFIYEEITCIFTV